MPFIFSVKNKMYFKTNCLIVIIVLTACTWMFPLSTCVWVPFQTKLPQKPKQGRRRRHGVEETDSGAVDASYEGENIAAEV